MLKVINTVSHDNITNIDGRKLQGSCVYEGELDGSLDNGLLDDCFLGKPTVVGPYLMPDKRVEFRPVGNFVLFEKDNECNDICLDDVNQGMIGDCWFLAAIIFSIYHPMYHEKLRTNVCWHDEKRGIVKVRLYATDTNEWQETFVDTRLLLKGSDLIPVVVSVLSQQPNELWAAMLEKGLAKMLNGYKNIEGGFMSIGMRFLHGGRAWFFGCHDFVPKMLESHEFLNDFVSDLKYLYDQGYGLFTCWESDMFKSIRDEGLVDMHAYSILDMKFVNNEWVFMLSNPWHKFEWLHGKYSNEDLSEGADLARREFKLGLKDDGVFLMSAWDLFGRCQGIDVFEPLDLHLL